MPPKKAKKTKKARKRESGGPYICSLCSKGFTRRTTVKEPHFASCVAKRGNPNRLTWDAHESCWSKRPGGRVGPSGVAAPGMEKKPLEEEQESRDGVEDGVDDELDEEQDQDQLDLGRYEEEDYENMNVEKMQGMGGHPANPPQTPTLQQYLPYYSSSPQYTNNPPLLPTLVMNQLANIPIMACRTCAGTGSLEALRMWELWSDMLPDDALSYVRAPPDGSSQKARQQAVVWMAQDVYAALLRQVRALADQLKMVTVWRDIMHNLGDADGIKKIHDILITAIGENGPLLLDNLDV